MEILSRLRLAILLLVLVVALGVLGYHFLFGLTIIEALYMTVITISTVGFREVVALGTHGKLFTIFLIIFGVGTVVYVLGEFIDFLVEGHLKGIIEGRKMRKEIARLKEHYIICGFGRVGSQVVRELRKTGASFVVIEKDPEKIEVCKEEGILCVEGDASEEEILKGAGIEKAKGLVAAVDTDADNVFVTLTAKGIRPDLYVIARANFEESEEKLKKAGADRVISPAVIGGRRIAALLIKPLVCNYLDVVCQSEDMEFYLEEITADKGSPFIGKTIKELDISKKTGASVLAIQKKKRELITNPTPETYIEEGDRMVLLGTKPQFEKLSSLYLKKESPK